MNPGWRNLRGHRSDLVLALMILSLVGIGLIMMYSISPIITHNYSYFFNQLKYAALGLAIFLVVARVPYSFWQRYATWGLGLAAFSILLLVPFGRSSLGATRWVQLGSLSFQPAELLKLALIIYLAAWFVRHQEQLKSFGEGVVPFAVMIGVAAVVIVVFQRDLGTAAVLALATVGMYFGAGLQRRHLALLVAAGLALIVLAVLVAPHRIGRLTTFLHPSQDPTGQGYQINQALIGVGSGGILGVGLGKSIQVHGYEPEASTDSIFAIIAEELGLVGSLVILGLYAVMVYRGLEISRHSTDGFARLLSLGIVLWLGIQAIINIGAILAVVPLTGIPLPYISYGGTNLLVSLVGAGILLNISKFTTANQEDHAYTRQRRGDGRTRLADSSYRRRAPISG